MALAAASSHIVLAHVIHDLRPSEQSLADEAMAAELAARLAVPFVSTPIHCAQLSGNAEQNARRLRYAALARLAAEHRCPFIATGHQGDDQLETLLMRLIGGGSLSSLAGIRAQRACHGSTLVRPMLEVVRADSERICSLAGWRFADDHTNRETHRTRAKLRHDVVPLLRQIREDAARQSAIVARAIGAASIVLDDLATELYSRGTPCPGGISFLRNDLRAVRSAVACELVVLVCGRLGGGTCRRADVVSAVDAIRGDYPGPRFLLVGSMTVSIAHAQVSFSS